MSTLGPAPGRGELTIMIPCGTEDPTQDEVGHPMTVRADWSLDMPHDLEAERVAVALGGVSTCLDLAAGLVPALRHLLAVMTRASDRLVETRWCALGRCHGTYHHASDEAAYRHEITPVHLAARFGLRTWQAERLLDAAGTAWLAAADLTLVDEGREGYARLWSAAIHPELVPRLLLLAPPRARSMPWKFFVDAAYGGASRVRPPAQDAADTPLFRTPDAAEVQTLVSRWQREWHRVGCRPQAEHYELVVRHRIPHLLPEPAQIDRTLALCRLVEDDVDRTDVGIMLAMLGEPILVATAVQHGITSALDPRLNAIATRGEPV